MNGKKVNSAANVSINSNIIEKQNGIYDASNIVDKLACDYVNSVDMFDF